jgi:hypothetical protein
MLIPNITEKPDLAFWSKHTDAESVNGSVTESLVVEATGFVEVFKVFGVRLIAKEVEIPNFKV